MSTETQQQPLCSGDVGEAIEEVMCDRHGLRYTDGEVADAYTSDGEPVQIKACRIEHSNGPDETVPGRWDAWSEELVHLIHDGGMYLLAVYDHTVPLDEPDRCIVAERWLSADEFGALIPKSKWHDAHRPGKGRRARVFWTAVFDREVINP